MRKLSAVETTEFLLESFREAEAVFGTGEGRSGEQLPPMMSKLWRQGSYRRLEELLVRMAVERPSQFVHVRARYLAAADRVIEVRVIRSRKGAEPCLPPYTVARGEPAVVAGARTARIAVRVYSAWVRLQKVRLGVEWLTSELEKQGGVWLPPEILETVAA